VEGSTVNRLAAGLICLLTVPCPAWAWPPCGCVPTRTFREDARESKLIVWGVLDNPRKNPNGEFTDVLLGGIVKSHPMLHGKTVLTLPRKIEIADRNNPQRMLIFCDIHKGTLDPFLGVVASPAVVGYLKGLLASDASRHDEVLRYCFDFLDHPDPEIAGDATKEFLKVPDRDLGKAARKLPAAKLRLLLRDPKTTAVHQRLFGLLLGHCGTPEDAILLHSLAARLAKKGSVWIDGILVGYVLLESKAGWKYVRDLLADPSSEFLLRYSALRTVRWFHDNRPEVFAKKTLMEALKPTLDQSDIADLVVNDLGGWGCWDLTNHILSLHGKKSHDLPVIRRSIVRYALRCPREEAAKFIVSRRNTDGVLVSDTEELLRTEGMPR
jgi:hypothetical protein